MSVLQVLTHWLQLIPFKIFTLCKFFKPNASNIYYFQNTIYFVVITLTYTDCCLKLLMLKYYNKEIMCSNYFGLYVIHDSFFIWIYTIMVPAKAHKYIEINLYTEWMPTCLGPAMWPSSGMWNVKFMYIAIMNWNYEK